MTLSMLVFSTFVRSFARSHAAFFAAVTEYLISHSIIYRKSDFYINVELISGDKNIFPSISMLNNFWISGAFLGLRLVHES